MCERISQAFDYDEYLETLRIKRHETFDLPEPSVNLTIGSKPLVIHHLQASSPVFTRWNWGYALSNTYDGKVNRDVTLDTILKDTSSQWMGSLKSGRMIIPADGWYECVGNPPFEQPWYVRPWDRKPIFFAALSGWKSDVAPPDSTENTGFAIVTDGSLKGVVDDNGRRPIVLTHEDALEWINPQITTDEAKELLEDSRPEFDFQWYRVTRKVLDARYQEEDSNIPILD